jgi:hypothetical protein
MDGGWLSLCKSMKLKSDSKQVERRFGRSLQDMVLYPLYLTFQNKLG